MRSVIGLVVSVAICLLAARIASRFTQVSIRDWYPLLEKPAWTPPNWVFAPAWITLYLMMAVAAWMVWRLFGFRGAAWALGLFGLQLVFNVAWSVLFFGLQRPGLAFADIALLWVLILATCLAFWQLDRTAGWLLVPYLVWVAYAAALNFAIWRMNG